MDARDTMYYINNIAMSCFSGEDKSVPYDEAIRQIKSLVDAYYQGEVKIKDDK